MSAERQGTVRRTGAREVAAAVDDHVAFVRRHFPRVDVFDLDRPFAPLTVPPGVGDLLAKADLFKGANLLCGVDDVLSYIGRGGIESWPVWRGSEEEAISSTRDVTSLRCRGVQNRQLGIQRGPEDQKRREKAIYRARIAVLEPGARDVLVLCTQRHQLRCLADRGTQARCSLS